MGKPMTNYDERLDEIFAPLIDSPSLTLTTAYWDEAKQAITSLIKELVAGAKPEIPALFAGLDDISVVMYKKGTDEYEANLLKALGEV